MLKKLYVFEAENSKKVFLSLTELGFSLGVILRENLEEKDNIICKEIFERVKMRNNGEIKVTLPNGNEKLFKIRKTFVPKERIESIAEKITKSSNSRKQLFDKIIRENIKIELVDIDEKEREEFFNSIMDSVKLPKDFVNVYHELKEEITS